MKLQDLAPKVAKFYLQHPVTLEHIEDDNGEEVYWNVVGRDSKEYKDSQLVFLQKLEELGDDADKLSGEDYSNFAQDSLVAVVVGWDEKFNDFHGGAFSEEKLREILDSTDHAWLTSQLDAFIAQRKNFFHQ